MGRAALLGLVGCILVAGCSDGGSGGGDGPAEFPPAPRSFDALDAEGTAITDEQASLPLTDPSSLPVSGGAGYTGVMGLVLSPEEAPNAPAGLDGTALVGDMRMSVDFGDNAVSAAATNFVSEAGVRVPGEITFDGGEIDRDVNPNGGGWTYEAGNAEGELTLPDGEAYRPLDGVVQGDFAGMSPDYAVGIVDLDLSSDGEPGPIVNAEGGFSLRRD